ncbi:MAG: TRAP transporter large permease [Geminicoccaceae bacterium]
MSFAALLMFVTFFGWVMLGMPIGYAMLCSSFLYFLVHGGDIGLVAAQSLNGLSKSFVLLAVPLYVFMANIMNAAGITDRMFDLANLMVGRLRGGLAHVNVLASVIFSGMSGSALADAAGPGKLEVEMMVKAGYSPGFSAAVSTSSAIIGPIIPPSIPMVLYGLISGSSIGYLFLGGVIPGLLMGAAQMGVIAVLARRRNFPVEPRVPRARAVRIVTGSAPAALTPVILLGGIYTGAVTPTEAAAVAVGYALLLALFWYRSLSWKALLETTIDSAKTTSVVAITIAGALVMNYVVAAEQIPNWLGAQLAGLDLSPTAFLLLINALFLVLGCFLDTLLMLLVVIPIILPAINDLGIDLVHFGVIIVINMMIGLVTPPYGELLFLISGVSGIPPMDIIRELGPFLIVLIGLLIVLVLFPDIVLWLPIQAGYQPAGG